MGQLDHRDEKLSEVMGLQAWYPPSWSYLGIAYEPLDGAGLSIGLAMRDELRNASGGPLHGGAVSSMLDIIGGIVVALGLRQEIEGLPLEEAGAEAVLGVAYTPGEPQP
jgi:acyl-coenzyme A thioesterase PaaI-like protein